MSGRPGSGDPRGGARTSPGVAPQPGPAAAPPWAAAPAPAGAIPADGQEAVEARQALERHLLATLDPTRVPAHIAIIMDGNGRWAEQRGLPRAAGHREGVETIRRVLEGCREAGVATCTLYAFSTENWRRPAGEVDALMALLEESLRGELETLQRNGVQFRVMGDIAAMSPQLQQEITRVMEATAGNRSVTLNLALNYGGRHEILHAVRRLAAAAARGACDPDAIEEEVFRSALYAPDLPDPDLLIRTGGEVRISNFLLWQAAYTELYFCDVYWPDFQKLHLLRAIHEFQSRRRRFGGLDVG